MDLTETGLPKIASRSDAPLVLIGVAVTPRCCQSEKRSLIRLYILSHDLAGAWCASSVTTLWIRGILSRRLTIDMTLAIVICPAKLLEAASTVETLTSGHTKLSFSIACRKSSSR